MAEPRNLREKILKAAQKQARRAAEKFYRCENKYAFVKERKLAARWHILTLRLKKNSPELFKKPEPIERWIEPLLRRFF